MLFAQEFVSLGRLVAKAVSAKRVMLGKVRAEQFNNAVETTRVTTIEKTVFEGAEVDAVNYPKKHQVVLNRRRWRSYHNHFRYKLALVLHEYLGILGDSDTHYAISTQYLPALESLSTKTLEQLLLAEIDSVCGDTWCEGDYNYGFISIQCSAEGCSLNFTMKQESVSSESTLKRARPASGRHSDYPPIARRFP